MLGKDKQIRIFQDRLSYIYAIFIIAFSILFIRLWYLQLVKGLELRKISEENRLRRIYIPAPRGMIFDRDGNLLIDNRPAFDLHLIPQYFQAASEEKQRKVIDKISQVTKIKKSEIYKKIQRPARQPKFIPIILKNNLAPEEVALIEMDKLEMIGIEIHVRIQRTSIHKEVGSHLIGYIAPVSQSDIKKAAGQRSFVPGEFIGKSGIEKSYEEILRGENGVEYFEVDAFGRRKSNGSSDEIKPLAGLQSKVPIPGKNFTLTIDKDLQLAAAKAFGKEKIGSLVAIDPRNGEVLAALSWPGFDSTKFSVGIDPKYWSELINNKDKPLRDKSIQDHYSPGSTFKIISTIAALEEGFLSPSTEIETEKSFTLGNRTYRERIRKGFGKVNAEKALAQSVDVFFYKLGTKINIDTLAFWAKAFGLGKKTNIKLPLESSGIVPTREWKLKNIGSSWMKGETLSVIIGQSYISTTPLQLANMIAAIANGGTLYKPRMIKNMQDVDGNIIETSKPELLNTISLKASTLETVRKGLKAVLSHKDKGTARWASIPGIDAAGKTGTTQLIKLKSDKVYEKCKNLKENLRHHGLFVAYAPIKNPTIAVAVVAEHSCSGSAGAAPIAMEVIKTHLSKRFPEKYGKEILKAANIAFWKKWKEKEKEKEDKQKKKKEEEERGVEVI